MKFTSYLAVFGLYLLLFGLMTFPYWTGDAIAPTRQFLSIGGLDNTSALEVENHKFSDFENGYIPEIWAHMHGNRSGWLALWTGQNELGRPLYQISGFSNAYPLSWVIAGLTNDPWRFITVLSLLTCFVAGVFIVLFCKEVGLHPLAGLISGVSVATSPLFMYWLTFPMFPAVWCWASGALWALTRLGRKEDLLAWSVLSFSGYSLLMTAYPQPVVFHMYLLAGYGIYLIMQKQKEGVREAIRFVALATSALLVSVALAAPIYADLARISAESARVAPDTLFFTSILPRLDSLASALQLLVLGTTPWLLGNPISEQYPFPYDGLSITPLVMFFAVISAFVAFKKTWGWWLAILVICMLAFVHPLYAFCVKYFGFGLSRSNPLGSITLPLCVIVAYGADALVRRTTSWVFCRAAWGGVIGIVAVLFIGIAFGLGHAITIRWDMVLCTLILTGLLAAQVQRTRPILLILALVLVLASISYPLMLRQNPAQIAKTSPLVEKVRASLPADSRFAVAAPGLTVLPPNLNAELGLPSVHSYNSLSPMRYHALIESLGGNVQTFGRWNASIAPDYQSVMFWMSNIGLMLSPKKLTEENLEYLGQESGVYLYKVRSRMGSSLQVVPTRIEVRADGLSIADPRLLPNRTPSKLVDEGDLMEFGVTSEVASVLILSQKFYRDWQAQVLTGSSWTPAQTIVVNGVFQGVLLPSDTQRVRLQFKPYARYAWIADVFWLFLLALLGFTVWRERRHTAVNGVQRG